MTVKESPIPETGAPPQMLKLHSLVGEWDIQFESRGSPDESFTLHQITSSITSLLNGAFLQERLVIPASSGRSIGLIGILGYDRYREQYRFAWLDDTYAIFDVHEGNWEGDALVVNNLRSATTFRFGDVDYFSRMIWSDITPDGFRVESDLSMDGGRTWFTQARLRYRHR